MALSSALFLTLLLCVASEFTMADEQTCSIGRYGALTMFNGEMVEMRLPCKFLLANITCGDFRVMVTPGWASDQEQGHRFSPDFVSVEVINTETSSNVVMFTSVTRLDKFSEGTVSNPWKKMSGSRSVVDVARYDPALAAAVLRKHGVFSVELSSEERAVRVTCSDPEFVSKGLPEALCGDGTTTDAMNNAITTFFSQQGGMTVDAFISYVVLNNTQVDQIMTCTDIVGIFTSCQYKEHAAVGCFGIFADLDLAECLAGSDTSLRDYYADCLKAVCDADYSALMQMQTYIQDSCQEPWLEKPCAFDTDCPGGINAECFEGKCLCTPGYFYSNGQDACVGVCPESDRQAEFLTYPKSFMDPMFNFLLAEYRGYSEALCQSTCSDLPRCTNLSYNLPYTVCYLFEVTALEHPGLLAAGASSDYNLFQKRCA